MDNAELVLYELHDKVAVITLNRPQKRNALSRAMWTQLDAAFQKAEQDPNVRIIVLAANGTAFCAGADIGGSEDPTQLLPWYEHFQKHHRQQFALWGSNKVIIAAVHGYAIGRGLEMALWCDIVIAADDAKLGQPEIREGMALWSIVPWLVGPQKAKLFMLSGNLINAHDAEAMGMVTTVVPAGRARDEAMKLATQLSHVPPLAARSVKHMVNGVYEMMGVRMQQSMGAAASAFSHGLSPEEKGTAEIERVRAEQGFKASLQFRNAPFDT